ncbi:MAG: hypothetical protein VKK59_05680, partial [Vampirovibrionales bacterium]|nr:hypothetical protein [Vampirovibrionales bacterium]
CLMTSFGRASHAAATENQEAKLSPSRFPSVQLTALDQSKKVSLPLSNKASFLAIGFHPDKQPQLEKAMALAQSHFKASKQAVSIIEVPVIEASRFPNNAVTRFFMKQQVKNKVFLDLVYPYYTNLRAFQGRLGLSESETMLLLLVDRSGYVVWSKKSSPTESDIKSWNVLLG